MRAKLTLHRIRRVAARSDENKKFAEALFVRSKEQAKKQLVEAQMWQRMARRIAKWGNSGNAPGGAIGSLVAAQDGNTSRRSKNKGSRIGNSP